MTLDQVLAELNSLSTTAHLAKLEHFGINSANALGIKVPDIRQLAKKIGRDHDLALGLWSTGIHEARMLASMVEVPESVAESQMDAWAADFDSWDLCDATCDLFGRLPFTVTKIEEYSLRDEEFVKRSAFAMMCELSFYSRKTEIGLFKRFFEIIEREAWDNRNFVRKAVNWALRQIGKRNETLR
ncbi:MAG TPA: DNA alkylation repair protein, partial [Paludibacter sp.]|nr:DNA alkylation repair protein [Paludibacter sp.]